MTPTLDATVVWKGQPCVVEMIHPDGRVLLRLPSGHDERVEAREVEER